MSIKQVRLEICPLQIPGFDFQEYSLFNTHAHFLRSDVSQKYL